MQPSPNSPAKDAANRAFSLYTVLLSHKYEEMTYEDVLGPCELAIQLNPNDSLLWRIQAECFHNLGDYDAALDSYEQTLNLNAEQADAWYFKAVLLVQHRQQYATALTAFEAALKLEPEDWEAWHNCDMCLEALNRLDEAIEAYDRAIELEPDCGEFWYQWGLALVDLQRYDEARENYDRAVMLDPGYRYVFYKCRACYVNNDPT
jgi:tetratricopeptide (TPR) repeat protein